MTHFVFEVASDLMGRLEAGRNEWTSPQYAAAHRPVISEAGAKSKSQEKI